jgi:hypothetical protein
VSRHLVKSVCVVATCTLAVACSCGDTSGPAATHSLAIETEAAPVTLPGTAQIAFGREEVAVAHAGDGAFSVFWVERRPTGPSSAVTAIREHRFDRSGALVDPDARELVPPAEDVRHASLATCSGDDGRAALVWQENCFLGLTPTADTSIFRCEAPALRTTVNPWAISSRRRRATWVSHEHLHVVAGGGTVAVCEGLRSEM